MPQMNTFGQWELGALLGKGMQAEVYKATHKETGQVTAVKFVDKNQLSGNAQKNLEREIYAMKALTHENIVKMVEVNMEAQFTEEDGNVKDTVAIVLELATGGELFDYLMHTGKFDETLARTYFKQLVAGLEHCHSKGISHRDIKGENVLLAGDFTLKLADFGLSAKHETETGSPNKLKTTCGTLSYMAPEILKNGKYDGPNTDVWSAGVLLFIMIAGTPPMGRASKGDWYFDRVRSRANQWSYFWDAHAKNGATFSNEAKEILQMIFKVNPDERATIAQLKESAWFTGAECDNLNQKMSERKGKVDEIKEAKRKEKDAEKAKKRAKRRNRNRGGDFDAYAGETYRGMGDSDEETKEAAAPAPLAANADSSSAHIFGKLQPPPMDIMVAAESTGAMSQAVLASSSSLGLSLSTEDIAFVVQQAA